MLARFGGAMPDPPVADEIDASTPRGAIGEIVLG
jgi:hypothetical protein